MARNFHFADFPLEPSQFVNNSGLRRGEDSGEIFCPRKLAHIGVMRCGEYQDADHCGDGCAAKAAPDDIARARAEIAHARVDKGGKRSWLCNQCGGPKRGFYSQTCGTCRSSFKRRPYNISNKGRGW